MYKVLSLARSGVNRRLQEKIATLPEEPGVYLMKNAHGRILYVGKAVNLRERVRSYFGGGDERSFVPLLDEQLADVEVVVVSNEKEALLLESELIRRHKPPFNAKLKEGKNFVYLRLDPAQRYPRLEVTRKVNNDGARYFGPYPLAHALRDTLRVVNKYFQLRTCSDHDPTTHKRPCLLCQIARFPSPSVYDIPPAQYRQQVQDAILFLEGKKTTLIDALQARMNKASEERRFEEAARIRDQLEAIERTLQPQRVLGRRVIDQDAISYARTDDHLLVYVLSIRKGRLIGGQGFPLQEQTFPEGELLGSFLNQYYSRGYYVPDEVLLPVPVDAMAALAELLSERKGMNVKVFVPREGDRLELVRMSTRNAEEAVRGRREGAKEMAVLNRLKDILGLSRIPHRMECFDISHFHGATIVASKVAMTDGRLDKDRYRRYRITSVDVGDDFGAMYEVVSRRLCKGLEEEELPDLLVLDGGKGQLASAQDALRDMGVSHIDVVALAKRRDVYPGRPGEKEKSTLPERVFLPGRKTSLVLPQDSPELLLLAHLRDEAHRFAITYQRKLMRQARQRSELEDIPGIGPSLRRALLRHFGSLQAIRGASISELSQVKGIGSDIAQRIHGHMHGSRHPPVNRASHGVG
jgi:excinuclease ABC subunit C